MAIAIDYEKGDSVFVAYPFPSNNYFKAQARTVDKVEVVDVGDVANVTFTDGEPVVDSNAAQTVFTTEPLADKAIVNDVITRSAAAVASDAELSIVSTAAQASVTLGRIG